MLSLSQELYNIFALSYDFDSFELFIGIRFRKRFYSFLLAGALEFLNRYNMLSIIGK
jgi:hypothetical protein